MQDLSALRILEIGDRPYVKGVLPDQTTFFYTGFEHKPHDPARGFYSVSPGTIGSLWRMARASDLSLIVCHPTYYSPWHWRAISRALFDRRVLRGHFPLVRRFGAQALRWRVSAPIAVIDFEDLPVINRSHLFLLDRCRTYFKRELPADHWRLFLKTAHANLPTPRFRLRPRQQQRLLKVRPISLGLRMDSRALLPDQPVEKTADIFFAGAIEGSSTVRARGFNELQELRRRGYAVDIPDRPLPPAEFLKRCAGAWLTWSPEGLGWDCFRHYEAAACGSTPLINQPQIERHQPLRDGEHAIYYDVERGGLVRAASAALADKPRLQRIAEAARAHVLTHHTKAAIVRYVIGETLSLAGGLCSDPAAGNSDGGPALT